MNTKKIRPNDSQFTQQFITNHADVINWDYITHNIGRCTHFSDEFFFRFNSMILWKKNFPENKLTTEFTYKYQDKLKFVAWYNKKKQLHRDNEQPALISANAAKYWYQNGGCHRDNDQPAVIYPDGGKKWFKNGQLHRDNDQPAVIDANGTKYWYQNGNLHRDNHKPTIIWFDEVKEWYQNGKLHRDNDQPAIIYPSGTKYWYTYGRLKRIE